MARSVVPSCVLVLALALPWAVAGAEGSPRAAVVQAFSQGNVAPLAAHLPAQGKVKLSASADIPLQSGFFSAGQAASALQSLFGQVASHGFKSSARARDPSLVQGEWSYSRRGSGARRRATVTASFARIKGNWVLRSLRIESLH
jgi:hypothetical protein